MKRGRRTDERRRLRQRRSAARQAITTLEDEARARYAALEASVRASPVPHPASDDALQRKLDAALARGEELVSALDAASITPVASAPGIGQTFATMARTLDLRVADAERETRKLVARVREGEWSRTQLAVIARALSVALDRANRAIEKARRARDEDPHAWDDVLREYLILRDRLRELGHAVLEMAG